MNLDILTPGPALLSTGIDLPRICSLASSLLAGLKLQSPAVLLQNPAVPYAGLPHTSTTSRAFSSADRWSTCPQASFNSSIRFACSSESNVFMVCHLDFIKGVGTKALSKCKNNSHKGSEMFGIYIITNLSQPCINRFHVGRIYN